MDYDPTHNKWLLKLRHDQVVKLARTQCLSLALDSFIARGTVDHGRFSIGDEDGVWDNMREANVHLQRLADTLRHILVDDVAIQPGEYITRDNWADPLKRLMESATVRVMGTHDYGLLGRMRIGVNRVCAVNHEYSKPGNRTVDLDMLVDVYTNCLDVVGTLWRELAIMVSNKFRARYGPENLVARKMSFTTKMWQAVRTVESLPRALTDNAGDVLTGLLDDTLELFDLADAITRDADENGVLLEGAMKGRHRAMAVFYTVAKKLAATDMKALKADGLQPNLGDESWNMAAKEGLVICMRGPPVYCSLPTDLPEQILDYVLHVLAALSLLFESPWDDSDEAEEANAVESKCDVAGANTGGDAGGTMSRGDVACVKCGGDVACDKGSPTRVLGRDVVRGTHATLKASRARRAGRTRTFPELGDDWITRGVTPWLSERWAAHRAAAEAKSGADRPESRTRVDSQT